MTLKQLEALYWIGQLGTFERAAVHLHTTQSTISKRIRELEQEVNLPLFDRSLRHSRMTEKGEQLLVIAEEMLSLQQRAANLSNDVVPLAKTIRLGVTEFTALTWLPKFIFELRKSYPYLTIEAEVDLGRNLYDLLLDDRLDLVIVPDAFEAPNIQTVHLSRVRNAWMGSPKIIKAQKKVNLSELAEYTLLVQGARSGSGHWINKWFQSESIIAQQHISSDSLVALLGMAVAGLGITYLPESCFKPLVNEGKLAIIETSPELPEIPYVALFRKDKPNALISKIALAAQESCDFSRQLQS